MTSHTINESQRKAAKVAALTCLIAMAIVVFATFGIHSRLMVAGNAAETARNILAHERLFRVGIACYLLYSVGLVVLLTSLYVILKPVSPGLALLAALSRFVYALTWVLMTVKFFEALRVLNGAAYMGVFDADQLQALARSYLGVSFDVYYVGLLFYSLASTICSYLWFKSKYVPRVLGAWGVISSAFCVGCTFVFIIVPDFARVVNLWWFDSPMALFELSLSLWLLFKGLKSRALAEPNG